MSVQARMWARGQVRGDLPVAAVLGALADYASKDGVAWVAQQTLAHDFGVSNRTIRCHLRALESDGLIGRVRTHDDNGHRATSFVVLAPVAVDRGDMTDATEGRYPDNVARLARGAAYRQQTSARDHLPEEIGPPGGSTASAYRKRSVGLPEVREAETLANTEDRRDNVGTYEQRRNDGGEADSYEGDGNGLDCDDDYVDDEGRWWMSLTEAEKERVSYRCVHGHEPMSEIRRRWPHEPEPPAEQPKPKPHPPRGRPGSPHKPNLNPQPKPVKPNRQETPQP